MKSDANNTCEKSVAVIMRPNVRYLPIVIFFASVIGLFNGCAAIGMVRTTDAVRSTPVKLSECSQIATGDEILPEYFEKGRYGDAPIVVLRDADPALSPFRIFVDGRQVANLKSKVFAVLYLSGNEHVLGVSTVIYPNPVSIPIDIVRAKSEIYATGYYDTEEPGPSWQARLKTESGHGMSP